MVKVSIQLGLRFGAGPKITLESGQTSAWVWFRGLWQGAAARLCSNKGSSSTREQTGKVRAHCGQRGGCACGPGKDQFTVALTLEFPGPTLGAGQTEQADSLPPCQPQPGWATQPQTSPQSSWLVVLAELTLCLSFLPLLC